MDSIEYLSLSDNEFEGLFSFELIANLSKLKVFKLSSRSRLLHAQDGDISLQPRFQMSVLDLQNCNLEKVPSFLQHQKELHLINLSHNKLNRSFPSWFLVQNPKLEVLLLQNNSFTNFQLSGLLVHSLQLLDVSANEFEGELPKNIGNIFPNLRHLNLSNNWFRGNLSSSLGEMNMLYYLDLSHNNFSGNLPMEFLMGCYSLIYLKLSYNKLTGHIFSKAANMTSLKQVIAENNQFSRISAGLQRSNRLRMLDLSSNELRGVVPSWLGEFSFTDYLSLSNNLLEGTIPRSLCNMSEIIVMDLSRNKFSGNLPTHFNCRDECKLFLNDNEFSGVIPDTLLKNINVLNLRNNFLSGMIPRFIGTKNIQYLILKGNRLTGNISKDLCDLNNIKMLDLANNRLNGSIPSCFTNMSFGKEDNSDNSYAIGDSYMPGSELRSYSGSHSLAVFNVSYNNLSGSIPRQGQFLTLDETNYIANPLLCGLPVNRSCVNTISEPEIQSRDGKTTIDMQIFYWSLATTYSVTWIAFTVFLCFDTSWRQAWFRLIDAFINLFKWV